MRINAEIPDELFYKLEEDAASKNLYKKDLVALIIKAYYADDESREILFGYDLLHQKFKI